MRLRCYFPVEVGALPVIYEVTDFDGFCLLASAPCSALDSTVGRNHVAQMLWRVRRELRKTRAVRVPPTGRLNA